MYTIHKVGWMAEWSCSGLQSRLRRFDSGFSLHAIKTFSLKSIIANWYLLIARVVELVDTRDLKSLDRNIVPVQVRPRVPKKNNKNIGGMLISKKINEINKITDNIQNL